MNHANNVQKRRRREYRQQRRAAFTRPEPGFGIYEGRTRGKRPRYNFEEEDDGDDFESDATSTRRSTRHQSARSTPFETGPTYTASGRQTKRPRVGEYGESLLSNNVMNMEELAPDYDHRAGSHESDPVRGGGRATRSGGAANGANNSRQRKHIDGYNSIDEMSDEDDAADDWDSDKNASGNEDMPDADDEESEPSNDEDDEEIERGPPRTIMVKLPLRKDPKQPSFGDGVAKSEAKEESTSHPIVRVPPPTDSTEDTNPGASKPEPAETKSEPAETKIQNGIENAAPLPSTAAHSEPQVILPAAPLSTEQYSKVGGTQNGRSLNGHLVPRESVAMDIS